MYDDDDVYDDDDDGALNIMGELCEGYLVIIPWLLSQACELYDTRHFSWRGFPFSGV